MKLAILTAALTSSLSAVSVWLTASVAQAQTTAPTPNSPIQQSGGFSNSNNSSRQFFQQGRDKLYFLEEADSVLEIDEEISEETEENTIDTEDEKIESTEQEQSE